VVVGVSRRNSILAALLCVFGTTSEAGWGATSRAGQAQMVADIAAGPDSSGPYAFFATPDLMFFNMADSAQPELWRSDGTAAGTYSLRVQLWRLYDQRGAFEWLNGQVFFTGWDEPELVELWTSDGTVAGTKRVTQGLFEQGAPDPLQPRPHLAVEALGLVFFMASEGTHGSELWVSNGETAGTHILADLTPGAAGSSIFALAARAGKVFIQRRVTTDQFEVWVTDGTTAGTKLLHTGSFIGSLVATSSHLYFFEGVPIGAGTLWTSDGTTAGTKKIATLPTGTNNSLQTRAAGDRLYFVLRTPTDGQEIWTSDGTGGGTRQLTHLADADAIGHWSNGTTVGDRLVVPAFDATLGGEMWVSDGTPQGTVPLNVCPGVCGFARFQDPFASSDGALAVFGFDDGSHGFELWGTDGTVGGTQRLTDLCVGSCSSGPGASQFVGGGLVIAADDGSHGRQLWWLDADDAPERVTTLPNNWWHDQFDTLATNDRLFFGADDGVHGDELWTVAIAPGVCVPDDHTLCLNAGRFEVHAQWKTQGGQSGQGHAHALTGDTGYFWFFDPANIEVVVKLLDACSLPGSPRFWFFATGLTNVEVTLTVTDTQSHVVKTYHNALNQSFKPIQDTSAFETCP